MENILNQIIQGLTESFPNVVFVTAVAYISVLMNSAHGEGGDRIEIASLAVLCIGSVPMINELSKVITQAQEAIGGVQAAMTSIVPGLTALNLSGDNVSGIAFFLLTEVIITLLNKVFFPMVLIYVALSICSAISSKFNVVGVKNTIRGFFTWGLGTMMIIFSVVSMLCGALGGAKQTMLGRTIKYTGSMVPVVGRYLSESADLTFASINVMKSTAGVSATTVLIGVVATPILKILSYVLLYRFCSTIIKPVDNTGLSNVTDSIADAFTMLGGIVVLVAVMSLMNIAMLIKITVG